MEERSERVRNAERGKGHLGGSITHPGTVEEQIFRLLYAHLGEYVSAGEVVRVCGLTTAISTHMSSIRRELESKPEHGMRLEPAKRFGAKDWRYKLVRVVPEELRLSFGAAEE